jgi:hypothetical protein
MPIRGSPNGARHPRPQAGRDRPEWVVAINRNAWSQSIGIAGRDHPVRAVWPWRMENQVSIWLSQDARVGVKWKWTFGRFLSQRSFFLWVLRLSRMTWSSRPGKAATRLFMKPRNSTRRRRLECAAMILPVATSSAANKVVVPCRLVVMASAGQGASVRQLQVALRALQCLDRRLLIDTENDRLGGRIDVQAHDIGGFRRKLGVGALAPRLAGGKVDLMLAQEAPDILNIDVAQCLGQQRPRPAAIALRWRLLQKRQNTIVLALP